MDQYKIGEYVEFETSDAHDFGNIIGTNWNIIRCGGVVDRIILPEEIIRKLSDNEK